MDTHEDDETTASLATLVVAGLTIAIMLMWMMIVTAPAETICLSKAEARKLWPKKHIYWYGKDHCWSNRRGGPPRGIKLDYIPPEAKAEAPKQKGEHIVVKVVKPSEKNFLDEQADDPEVYGEAPSIYTLTQWQLYLTPLMVRLAPGWSAMRKSVEALARAEK